MWVKGKKVWLVEEELFGGDNFKGAGMGEQCVGLVYLGVFSEGKGYEGEMVVRGFEREGTWELGELGVGGGVEEEGAEKEEDDMREEGGEGEHDRIGRDDMKEKLRRAG